MITFIKGNDTKFLSEESSLITTLINQGWEEKTDKKEIGNGKSSKSSNKPSVSLGAE